jgi:hypothetical protein
MSLVLNALPRQEPWARRHYMKRLIKFKNLENDEGALSGIAAFDPAGEQADTEEKIAASSNLNYVLKPEFAACPRKALKSHLRDEAKCSWHG